MDKDELSKAKDIFMRCGGNHFYMEREGAYDNYRSFNISKKQEMLWRVEYRQLLFDKIKTEDIVSPSFSELTSSIGQSKDVNGFQLVLDLINKKRNNIDTFSQLRMAEETFTIVESFKNDNDAKKNKIIVEAKILALDMLREIDEKPIIIAPYYHNIAYLRDALTEDKIKNRVQRLVVRWETI